MWKVENITMLSWQSCRQLFVSAPKCRDIVLASFDVDVDLGGACNNNIMNLIDVFKTCTCAYLSHVNLNVASLLFSRYLLPSFYPFIYMAFTPRQQSYTDIANTSTSVRDCVRQRNVTRYEKKDRSGYFIIFAFFVSIDSYACVRSNGAN